MPVRHQIEDALGQQRPEELDLLLVAGPLPPIGLWLTIAAGNLIAAACFTISYLRGSFLDKQV